VSRIGKKPINIKDVEVKVDGQKVTVKGKLGELSMEVHPNITVKVEGDQVIVTRPNDAKQNRALHGLTRALINNMVQGVTEGFKKSLKIIGVGFRAELKGNGLLLNLGYSHPIYFIPPKEIKIEVPSPDQIDISGIDKELVGNVAAKIRSFRKPEPYKGKGVRYIDEVIIRKAGKAAGK
jgi:large subunit ribosomal protein L6